MRILMLSKEGDGAGVAYKVVKEGHHVDFWIKDPKYKDAQRGIVSRPPAWRNLLGSDDRVVCDMVGFGEQADTFRKLGKPSLSCNSLGDCMELDRKRGMEVFRKLGINIPKTQYFKSIEEAAKLEWKSDVGYVIKASGNLDTSKTYLCEDERIYKWALPTLKGADDIIVQELIPEESAVEVSTEGWFNGTEFLEPFNHTFEEKFFMGDGIGKMTGCMGNVVLVCPKPTKLVEATVGKYKGVLAKANYRGPIDINCMVTKESVFALEMTCRMGYDAVESLMTGLKEPMGNLLFETALGTRKSMDIRTDFLMTVRVTRDPYPYAEPCDVDEDDKGMPICGLTEKDMDFVYLCDVYKKGEEL